MNYVELKEKHQERINNFPMIFAFSNKQLAEGMKKIGLNPTETDKLVSIGYGGFIHKDEVKNYLNLLDELKAENNKAIEEDKTGDGFILQMFSYELDNHEYIISRDLTDTLDTLGLTMDEVNSNENLKNGLTKALKRYK